MNVALESVGDPWSLLVVRDIVFYGKHTFGEFLAAKERITTSVLADRLATLVRTGILLKQPQNSDRRKAIYTLTEKGLDLIPILIELVNWGVGHDPEAATDAVWENTFRDDPQGLCQAIRATVAAGSAVFAGPNSLAEQLGQPLSLSPSSSQSQLRP